MIKVLGKNIERARVQGLLAPNHPTDSIQPTEPRRHNKVYDKKKSILHVKVDSKCAIEELQNLSKE